MTSKNANRSLNLIRYLLSLCLLLTAFDGAFANGGTGFSESTLSILRDMVLKRIYEDPKILEQATQRLIERQLALESKELDPAVVATLVERILYANSNVPQPPVEPDSKVKIPKIIMFMSGADIQLLNKIKKVLDSRDKVEILKFYFNLSKGTEAWTISNFSGGKLDSSDLEIGVPVHDLNMGDNPRSNQYIARFLISHPVDTWEFDDDGHSANLIISDPAQIDLISFNNGRKAVSNECGDVLKGIIKASKRK